MICTQWKLNTSLAYPPDLSPSEHVWNALHLCVKQPVLVPANIQQVRTATVSSQDPSWQFLCLQSETNTSFVCIKNVPKSFSWTESKFKGAQTRCMTSRSATAESILAHQYRSADHTLLIPVMDLFHSRHYWWEATTVMHNTRSLELAHLNGTWPSVIVAFAGTSAMKKTSWPSWLYCLSTSLNFSCCCLYTLELFLNYVWLSVFVFHSIAWNMPAVVSERSQQTPANAVRIYLGGNIQETAPLFLPLNKAEKQFVATNGPNFFNECVTELRDGPKRDTQSVHGVGESKTKREICVFQLFHPSLASSLCDCLKTGCYMTYGHPYFIWVHVSQIYSGEMTFYGHKFNLKTRALWALGNNSWT